MAHGARLVRLGNSGKSKEAPLFRSGRRGSGTMGARDSAALCGRAPRLRGDGRAAGHLGVPGTGPRRMDGSLAPPPKSSPDLARPSTNPLPNAQTCLHRYDRESDPRLPSGAVAIGGSRPCSGLGQPKPVNPSPRYTTETGSGKRN